MAAAELALVVPETILVAAEFIVRLRPHIDRNPLSALTLAQDTSTLTACINDYGSEYIFKRVFSALSFKGDTLLAITTSGNSKNIIETFCHIRTFEE